MPSMDIVARNAAQQYKNNIQEYDIGLSYPKKLALYKESCIALKVTAYAALLSESNPERFFAELLCLAKNWRQFILECQKNHPDNTIPASNADGLYAAIVCEDMPLMVELSRLSARQIVAPEYDDEFYFTYFIQEMIRKEFGKDKGVEEFEEIFKKIEIYMEETPPLVDVFRTMVSRDKQKFQDAFIVWHEINITETNHRADSATATYTMSVTRYIHLQALAILKLGELLGLTIEDNIELIPGLTRKLVSVDNGATILLDGGN